MKFNLLAFETSSSISSLSLLKIENQQQKLTYINSDSKYKHAENIIPMANKLLNESNVSLKDLKLLAIDNGPGSFIGTRVSCGIVNGISLTLGISIISISSHEIMLEECNIDDNQIAFIGSDAHNNEIYLSIYDSYKDINGEKLYCILNKPIIISINQISQYVEKLFEKNHLLRNKSIVFIGEIWKKYEIIFLISKKYSVSDICFPKAKYLAILAKKKFFENKQNLNNDPILPIYIRHKVALTTQERQLKIV